MTLLAIRDFGGMSPKTPPYALPANGSQEAVNCDFSHGDLRGINGLFPLLNAGVSARSLYSEDGFRFYAWSDDVDPVRSPQADDKYNRMYFTQGGQVKTAFTDMMAVTNPTAPATTYMTGVPAPTAAPTTRLTDKTVLPLEATGVTGLFWYELSGQKYQQGTVALVQKTFGRAYTAVAPAKVTSTPAKTTDTPETAVACLQIMGNKGTVTVFTLTSDNSTSSARNTSIPGGATLTLTAVGLALTATINYGSAGDYSYLYTHVNIHGEESAPSDPVAVSFDAMQKIEVMVSFAAPSGGYFPIFKLRLYRTNTSSNGYAKYQFCKDQGCGATAIIPILDDVETSALGEVLATEDWYPPPVGLSGLLNLGNGILAAFRNNELHFCEAYVPYAWNPFNVVTLPYDVVGLCAHLGGMVVVTTAYPYLVSGISADSMTSIKVSAMQGGISKRAIADLGTSVVYASNDGLVVVTGGQATLEFSQMFWTRTDWRAKWGVSELQLAAHDGHIIGFMASGTSNFIARLDEAAGSLTHYDQWATGAFVVPNMDGLYYAQGNVINRFTGSGPTSFVWHSKDFILKKPENFGVAQIVLGTPARSSSVTIEFYADGVLKYTKSVTAIGAYITFRLPSGFMARRWSFKLSGSGEVKEFYVATAGVELGNM